MSESRIVFAQGDSVQPWHALRKAEAYIREQGWSVGPTALGGTRGIIKRPDVVIAKWRNLTQAEKDACDGVMTGTGRYSDRVIHMEQKGRYGMLDRGRHD